MFLFVVTVLYEEKSTMSTLTMKESVLALAPVGNKKHVTYLFQKRNLVRIVNGAIVCLCFSWQPISCFLRTGMEGVSTKVLDDIAMYQTIVLALWAAAVKVILGEDVFVSSPVPKKFMKALRNGAADLPSLEDMLINERLHTETGTE
jgi:hypothetical protein